MKSIPVFALCLMAASAAAQEPISSTPSSTSSSSVSDFVQRGMERFRVNEIQGSIEEFQHAIKLDPRISPYLWQLGISYYYAEEFQLGRELFESHQTVNGNDVENAAWYFLCVARIEGVEAAQKQLLKLDTQRDTRVPMSEVYELYAGRGTVEDVLAAAKQVNDERASMYAHLYLGLFYEVAKQPEKARKHLKLSAAAQLSNNYMHDVAKVHLLQRKWNR